MLEAELQNWRREIDELFREARVELKDIISALDEMIAPTHESLLPAFSAPVAFSKPTHALPREVHVTQVSAVANDRDSSRRLDYLKRQLNERLQGQPPLSDACRPSKSDETP